MSVTAEAVKALRERTGAGMMECKKALVNAGGDIEKAIDLMRKSGVAKAATKAARIAAEGVVVMASDPLRQRGAMVEVNCETDFVTRADDFRAFAETVAECVLREQPESVEAMLQTAVTPGGDSIAATCQLLVAKIGEKIEVRRFALMESPEGHLGRYQHGTRIGVMVSLRGGTAALAKDLAMHIAASKPICVSEAEIPPELLAREREIYGAQAAETGKPPAVVEKMIAGKLDKFKGQVTLLGQEFIRDDEITVADLLAKGGAKVIAFERFEVGEGIEKKTADFAAEVMARVRGD